MQDLVWGKPELAHEYEENSMQHGGMQLPSPPSL